MQSENILTHRRMLLDNNVWVMMIITCICCLGLVSYRLIVKEPCTPFTLSVTGLKSNNGIYDVGETLIFRVSLATSKQIVWDFGDKTEPLPSENMIARHTFTKEGSFNISAMSNGRCTSNQITINVKKGNVAPGQLATQAPEILGNFSNVIAGKPQNYISKVIGTDYEWKILDRSTFQTITQQSATYTFPKAGVYVLQLTIDHDREHKRTTKEILVSEDVAKAVNVPKPPPIFIPPMKKQEPKQEPKQETKQEPKQEDKQDAGAANATPPPVVVAPRRIIGISNDGFKNKLEGVIEGQNDVKDFDRYLADGGNTKVVVNNDRYLTLKQYCEEIQGKKKISIEDVQLIKADDGQIQRIMIKAKKKGFLF